MLNRLGGQLVARQWVVSVMFAVALLPISAAKANNTFVQAQLRTDLSYLSSSQAFNVSIDATALPSVSQGQPGDFTAGWLGIFPGAGQPLVQVGLITDANGVRWFAYSLDNNHPMTCTAGMSLRLGNGSQGNGCFGNYNAGAALNQWQAFSLYYVPSGGYWVARVFAPGSRTTYTDVAKVSYGGTNYATEVDGEEGYNDLTDPYVTMSFFHWHPQYWTGSAWQNWPASPSRGGPAGANNQLFVNPSAACPSHYAATLYEQSDPLYWFTGTAGGASCSVNPMF